MTDRSVVHDTFVLERRYPTPPEWTMDFRVGGIEIIPDCTGTHLIFTEQGAFLDGHDQADGRRPGTSDLLDAMGDSLRTQSVDA